MNDNTERDDPRLYAIPDVHGHCKGEHKPYAEERPLPLTARMLFLWFYHACRRGYPRFLMVADHMNYLTFEDPASVNLVRRALKLAQAGDLYGAAETAGVDVGHAAVVSEGLRRGMRFSIGAEVDNDPRSRPDAQNIVEAMRPDAMIRSVHFLPITHPVHGENWSWPFDNPEFQEFFDVVGTDQTWELYVAALIDAIERLPGHIVGHFYVPAVFGHWPEQAKLEEYEDRMLAAAGARGMAVEFNTRFLYREHSDEDKARYLEANKRLLRKARDRGVGIAIGSDAHSPRDQGGAFEIVLDVLDELEINELVFPIGGLLRRVALRVVREPEPEPAPVPEPPPPPPVEAGPPKRAKAPVERAPAPVRAEQAAPEPAVPAEAAPAAANGTASTEEPVRPAPRRPKRPARPAEPAVAAAPGPAPEAVAPAVEPVAEARPAAPPHANGSTAPAPPAAEQAAPSPAPVSPSPAAPARKPQAPAKAPAPKPMPAKAAPAKPAPAKPAPAKPAAKPIAAKAAPAKKTSVKAAPAKPVAKPSAKKSAKPAPKRAAPKPAAKKAGSKPAGSRPAKPAAKPAPKRAAPKPAAKKAVAKKTAAKKAPARPASGKKASAKSAPARSASVRRGAPAKKTVKKTASKRR
ncbi:MAG TPA: hypothetical protein VMD91_14455 [Candidatus Sulfotelmatobacter sp.]|nr:hypothetical protein [Candidatus Sulfotelmatobacter sp.]